MMTQPPVRYQHGVLNGFMERLANAQLVVVAHGLFRPMFQKCIQKHGGLEAVDTGRVYVTDVITLEVLAAAIIMQK